jgi:hypothetical protein
MEKGAERTLDNITMICHVIEVVAILLYFNVRDTNKPFLCRCLANGKRRLWLNSWDLNTGKGSTHLQATRIPNLCYFIPVIIKKEKIV